MRCQRCHGLMVPDFIEERPEQWVLHCVSAWRCVVCGEVIDPVIVANRVNGASVANPRNNGNNWNRLKFAVSVRTK